VGIEDMVAETRRRSVKRVADINIEWRLLNIYGEPEAAIVLLGRRKMNPLNIRVVTWSLATFTSFSFVVCVLYGLIVPESFHSVQFLENTLPGFKWLTIGGFFIGLIESFLYGVYVGLVFTPVYNFYQRKWG
jgi:hypothetical protein